MIEIEPVITAIDAHIKASPNTAVLEQWRQLRDYITVLDDQRYVYLVIGVALGILGAMVVALIGGTHP